MSNNDKENNKVWNQSLDDIMSESFGKYAKYIIQDRALPDIRDGLNQFKEEFCMQWMI